MTALASFPDIKLINNVSRNASSMGYEIVDLAGFLDLVEHQAQEQRSALSTLNSSANSVTSANAEVFGRISDLMLSVNATSEEVENCAKHVRSMSSSTRDVANWVQELGTRAATVSDTVQAMKKNNSQIGTIALQVNTLAINAKIEAARAGDMGRGFAVVAEAINELSQQTRAAADQISTNIETLADWISALGNETEKFGKKASTVLEGADSSDAALSRMETSLTQTQSETQQIEAQSEAATKAMNAFAPNLTTVSDAVHRTSSGITEAHSRIEKLIDTSESLVQQSAAMGGTTQDAPFIDYVKAAAKKLSDALSASLANGEISMGALFSRTYTPIEGSDPPQVMAPFTKVFDRVLPAIQEPALEFDSKVVFCAAVDQNGYLPTHNRKFSKPQGNDPVWNTANCRNRRIFDDRVGLKAGRNTRPFLLQVYRRDMGGGNFVLMKDLSAPIFVNDKHWGGLRFAYTF